MVQLRVAGAQIPVLGDIELNFEAVVEAMNWR